MVKSGTGWKEIAVILAVLAVLATMSFSRRITAEKHGRLAPVELPVAT